MLNAKLYLLKKFLIVSFLTPMFLSVMVNAADPIRIMPLGDSITEESNRDEALKKPDENLSSYRNDLWYLLQGNGYDVDFVGSLKSGQDTKPPFDVDHEGHAGLQDNEMAANVYGYLDAARIAGNPVDVALLHIGTNVDADSPSANDIETTLNEIDQYELDYNTNVTVILARIINCRQDWDNTGTGKTILCKNDGVRTAQITTFNDNVENMANARIALGDDIIIADMENGAGMDYNGTDGSSDMIDDLHPNDSGYAKMANLWYEKLESILTTHQVHYWNLNEEDGETTFSDSHNEADGTCSGAGCPTAEPGIIFGSQEFSGTNDGISVTNISNFKWGVNDDFTIEFWMKPDTAATDAPDVVIGQKNSSNSWWIGRVGSKIGVSIDDGLTSNLNIDTSGDQWTHVVMVRDATNSELRLYINGKLDPSKVPTTPKDYSNGDVDVTIGWYDNSFYFNGGLDEIALYDNAMDPTQIQRRYENGVGGFEITSEPVTSAAFNSSYSYNVNTSDDTAAFGNYTLPVAPNGMGIDDDGLIEWTADIVGNIPVHVVANNGSIDALQNFEVKVRDISNMPSAMTHYWKLNENTGETTYIDEYNGATDATCSSIDCPTQIEGQVDEAQDLSGVNAELDVPDDASFDWAAGDSFTVEFWMKPDSTTTNLQVAVGRHKGTTGTESWWVGRENNKIKFQLDSSAIASDKDITLDQWTHVAIVRDATNNETRLYINGEIDGNSITGTTPNSFTGEKPFNIGWYNDGYWFDGALDDIAIFDGALPANEIAAHHANGSAGNGFDNPDVTAPDIILTGANPQVIPVGTAYTELGATANDNIDGDISAKIVIDPSAVDTSKVASYGVTYTVSDAAGNIATETRTVNVVDTTAPVITLTGSASINLLLNDTYTEEGATCTDNYDPTCTVTIGGDTVDTSTVGNYTVTYNATDASGNAAIQLTRTVNVTAGNAPVINLIGDNPYIIEVYSTYVDPGATATDIEDGTVAVSNDSATSVDTAMVGTYTVAYTATDLQGNTSQATRTVEVVDTAAPVITLTGSDTINLLLGNTYTEEGATCTDNYDATCSVTIGGDTVDTSTVGNYTVTYNAMDTSGNIAIQVTRTVNVIAGNVPVITLNGDNPYTVEVDSTYVDPGATATDIEDDTVAVTNDSATSVNTAIVGTYTVTYTATDSHGNTVQTTRTVNVVDELVDDWYTVSPDGNTYTVGDSSVELDSNLFTITINADSIVFGENGTDPKIYIILMNDGEVFTGYTESTVENPTVDSGFAPGTKVSVDVDGVILIETPLTTDLTFGGK